MVMLKFLNPVSGEYEPLAGVGPPGADAELGPELEAIAALDSDVDQLPYYTGPGTAALTTLTAYMRNLLNRVDVTAFKTAIGIENVANTSDATKNSATATLTNKRITRRVGSTGTTTIGPNVNTDLLDGFMLTTLGSNPSNMSNGITGTPTEGQTFWFAITDNGTSRTITWGSLFESSTYAALPGATIPNVRMDILFIWNSVTSKWRCVAVS
jgi:hypothetical protein